MQNCPAAHRKPMLAIHGAEDQNVPIVRGQETVGLSRAIYNSENDTQQVFVASGADFGLQIVQGADHRLENINDRIEQTEGRSLAEKAATFWTCINNKARVAHSIDQSVDSD